MDAQGVQVQALSLTVPMVYWAAGGLAQKLAETFNDALAAAHQSYPGRLLGLATLPMQDANLAVAEAKRIAGLPGIKGVLSGNPHPGPRSFPHPDFPGH